MNLLCHAYCLMGNHYHLLVETPDGNLSLAMRQLNGVYAQAFNRRHERVGHLFQGRYLSKLVEKDTYLLAVSRYIELNPVRAGYVARPDAWEWSSFRAHIGSTAMPVFLSSEWLLAQFDPDDRDRARCQYRDFVLEERETTVGDRGGGPILGSTPFVEQFRDVAAGVASANEIPRRERFIGRPELEQLFGGSIDRNSRNRRIVQAYVEHGYTMAEISRFLGLSRMTISRAIGQCCNVRPDP